jgi:hypothetical protein
MNRLWSSLLPDAVARRVPLLIEWIRTGRRPRPSRWRIGIFSGPGPLELAAPNPDPNPILSAESVTDVPAEFVADPFMIQVGGVWYCFFEVLNTESSRGEIGYAQSMDLRHWRYGRIVLRESFHVSYPYVFEWEGGHYMIPETSAEGSVRLYRATAFPTAWTLDSVLLEGGVYNDASVLHHAGRWWMFIDTSPTEKNTLRLYHAPALRGPWVEHPRSPVVDGDSGSARPAGRVVAYGGSVIRFAQDCRTVYGEAVRAFVISRLTDTEYEEHPHAEDPLLGPSGRGWNRLRMHTVDPHPLPDGRWVACVDGRG